jgi:hypothetical protein
MNTKQAKELVREYESARTGIELLNEAHVKVVNVRVNKKVITADVICTYIDEGSVRSNNKTFSIAILEQFHRTRVF